MCYRKREDIETYLYRLNLPWRDTEDMKLSEERKRVPITRLGYQGTEELQSQFNEQLVHASRIQSVNGEPESWLGTVHGILEQKSPSQVLVVDIELPTGGGPYASTRFANALNERRLSYHVTIGSGERVFVLVDFGV